VEEQGGLPLPSFSAYPQAYVTSVGEYLLTLPQQLEPLAEGITGNEAGNDEAQFFATEWIFKVINVKYLYLCTCEVQKVTILPFLYLHIM
jgi:bacillopeptidase F (M6 metalloprotease family)